MNFSLSSSNSADPTKSELQYIDLAGGIIYNTQNKDNLNLYYYTPIQKIG